MMQLQNKGWKLSEEPLPLEWKDGGSKIHATRTTDFVNRRFFFLCLLNWESLKARGLNALPTDRPHAYYKLLLTAAEPANVLMSLSNKEYLSICDVGPAPEPFLSVNDHERECVEMQSEGEDAFDLPPAKRQRMNIADSSPLIALPLQCPTDLTASSMPPEQEEVPSPQKGFNFKSGVFISSSQVVLEKHRKRGEKGAYCRLIVYCTAHTGCKKHRNINACKGLLGVKEALAFLAHWSNSSSSFSSSKEHVPFQPRPVVNDAQAIANGMELVEGNIGELARQVSEF